MADFKRFKVGDVIQLTNEYNTNYNRYSSVWDAASEGGYDSKKLARWEVTDVKWGTKYEYQEKSQAYENSQLIKFRGANSWFDAEQFKLAESANDVSKTLAIDVDRPCLVQEIQETTVDGKVVIVGVGDFTPFDSSRAANVWAAEQISNSIRTTNTYRKFRIYQEKSVAQAKKPEIEYV